MINFKSFLTEAKKKKTRKDRFTWKEGDVTVTKAKGLKEAEEHHGTWENPRTDHVTHRDEDKPHWNDYKHQTNNHEKYRKETEEHLSSEAEKHAKTFSDEHHAARKYYKADSGEINMAHRHIPQEHLAEHIKEKTKNLDHITSQKTSKDMHVYRGFSGHEIHKLQHGDTVHDKAYVSTSVSHATARQLFASAHPTKYDTTTHKHVLAKIHVPAGTKGYHIDHHEDHENAGESEFLLHRGTHFKVTGHSHDPATHTHYVHMTVHHQDEH